VVVVVGAKEFMLSVEFALSSSLCCVAGAGSLLSVSLVLGSLLCCFVVAADGAK